MQTTRHHHHLKHDHNLTLDHNHKYPLVYHDGTNYYGPACSDDHRTSPDRRRPNWWRRLRRLDRDG